MNDVSSNAAVWLGRATHVEQGPGGMTEVDSSLGILAAAALASILLTWCRVLLGIASTRKHRH